MNLKMVAFILGRILQLEGLLMLLPLGVSIYYQEPIRYAVGFLATAGMTFIIGLLLSAKKVNLKNFYAKEGFVIVALSWLSMSFFGSLPFVFSGDIPQLVDAFFETASGFTTTGASILNDVEVLSRSMLWWRSFTHLIGGMGVLVFALAVIPKTESQSVHIMKAEVPGPIFGKLVSRLSSSARILYIIYLVMTLVVIILLWLGGLPLFDATTLAFGTAGTGGFGVRNGSILPYDSLYVEIVLGVGMMMFGVNFNLYYYLLLKHVKVVFKNEELRWYLGIVLGAIALITFNLYLQAQPISQALRDSFFAVASIVTTTGFSTADFNEWPLFSHVILLLLMFVGGMAGSTAGGLKVSRVGILVKTAIAEFKQTLHPNRIVSIQYEYKPLDYRTIKSVANYAIVYALVFIVILLSVSTETGDFTTAFSSVAATFNNIGPGLGDVGPANNFSFYSGFNKFILSIAMIMGRLEIFPILILLSGNTWWGKD